MIYLACPYTDRAPEVMQQRYELVTMVAGKLMQKGHHVFSPITHGHPIAMTCNLPTDWNYWEGLCIKHIRNCSFLAVLTLPGWSTSIGVCRELELAAEYGLPITHLYLRDYQ